MHRDKIRLYFFYVGIVLTIFGMPFSRALLSFGQVIFAALFLFDRNLFAKIKTFFSDKSAIAFTSFYFVLWFGLLYSDNINYGLNDLRTKLPLLLFPLVFVTEKPLKKTIFRFFLILFAATVIASFSTALYIYHAQHLTDFRLAFVFVSHIRMSLMALVAMSILLYYTKQKNNGINIYIKIIMLSGVAFLFFSMIILELLSGLVIFAVAFILFMISQLLQKINIRTVLLSILVFLLLGFTVFFVLQNVVNSYHNVDEIDLTKLEKKTVFGNEYEHHPFDYPIENGSYIGIYIQWTEMQTVWNKRSHIDFAEKDNIGQSIKFTLLRYLNSKHLRKDAIGVGKLTKEDIENIENGIANEEYTKKLSYKKRIYKILWEYDMFNRGQSVSGYSLLQRLELWKTGFQIVLDNPIIGVGTGDVIDAFKNKLIENQSQLKGSGLRNHNQFLASAVGIGFVGLLVFLLSMFYPPTLLKIWNMPLFFYFFSFLSISMLWEDTLETQVGVSLYAFFFAYYLWGGKEN